MTVPRTIVMFGAKRIPLPFMCRRTIREYRDMAHNEGGFEIPKNTNPYIDGLPVSMTHVIQPGETIVFVLRTEHSQTIPQAAGFVV